MKVLILLLKIDGGYRLNIKDVNEGKRMDEKRWSAESWRKVVMVVSKSYHNHIEDMCVEPGKRYTCLRLEGWLAISSRKCRPVMWLTLYC